MKDREFDNYLALLSGMLRLRRTQREGIAGELRDHLIEHVAHLEASGSSHEEAVRRALEEFGDAAALAANFQALVGMRRRRLVMRCTIGTTVVMTGLVLAMLAFRPPMMMDDPSIAQAQAGPSDNKAAKGKAAGKPDSRLASDDGGARQRLQINKIDAEFNDIPVQDALTFLSDRIGVQVHVDKQSLENSSINNDTPVTLRLQNVPAEMVLDLILRQAQLGYRLRNGVILVASADDVQSQTEVRVYRVPEGMAEELAALIPDTIDAQLWSGHAVIVDPRGRRRAGYGSMGAPMGAPSRGGYGGAPGYGGPGYGAVEVAPGETIEGVGGGGAGTVRVFRGTLVISQTPEVHQKIEKLLTDLAGAGAMDPQKRSDAPGVDRTGMMPAPQPQGPASGQPGYGQATGYSAGGSRSGYGSAGGSRGGYGDAGYGSDATRRRGGGEQPGRGAAGNASPPNGNIPGQPPTSGGSTPVPRDPNATSNVPTGPSTPGGQPPGATDPNAAESGPTSPPIPPELRS